VGSGQDDHDDQDDHEGAWVAAWQLHHVLVEEEEQIVGKPQQDTGQRVGHCQVDEKGVIYRRVLARNAEPSYHADDKNIQGHEQQW